MVAHVAPGTIKRLGKESIEIVWCDDHRSVFPNRYLREHCPCASCRDQPARSLPVFGQVDLFPAEIALVGRYAISIQWSDHHHDGIYSYATLRALCPCDACQVRRGDAPAV